MQETVAAGKNLVGGVVQTKLVLLQPARRLEAAALDQHHSLERINDVADALGVRREAASLLDEGIDVALHLVGLDHLVMRAAMEEPIAVVPQQRRMVVAFRLGGQRGHGVLYQFDGESLADAEVAQAAGHLEYTECAIGRGNPVRLIGH